MHGSARILPVTALIAGSHIGSAFNLPFMIAAPSEFAPTQH
jgi:hypothetical protein